MNRQIRLVFLTAAAIFSICTSIGCTGSFTSEPSTQSAPAPEPALAIFMGIFDHPVHRQVQLGFLDTCEDFGYTDVKITGTDNANQAEQFAAAEEWAKAKA